jgi:hypothetical protein
MNSPKFAFYLRITLLLLVIAGNGLVFAQNLSGIAPPDSSYFPPPPMDSLMADTLQRPDTVDYFAQRLQYHYPSRTFSLEGKAQLKYRSSTLTADTIHYTQSNMLIEAMGDPVLQDVGNPNIYGYRMRYNLSKKIGQIYYGSASKDGQTFNGTDIRRLPDGRLLIARGDFSTCDTLDDQHYYFYSRRLILEPGKRAVAKPVVLNIADVPVAVLPMMVYPISTTRQSGLLTPKYGGDQAQGFYMENLGYYWAISDYMDFQSSLEIVEGADATFQNSRSFSVFNYNKRYVLNGNMSLRLFLQGMSLSNPDYDFNFLHSQNLTPDQKSTLRGSGSFVSRSEVRQQNALNLDQLINQQATANLTWSKSFYNGVRMNTSFYQNHNLTTGFIQRNMPAFSLSTSGPLFPRDEDEELDLDAEPLWYNKINYSYNWNANIHQRRERRDTLSDSLDTWVAWQDRLSLDYNGSLMDVINIRPSMNYQGYWSLYSWDSPIGAPNRDRTIDFDPAQGRFGDYAYNFSSQINASTKLYGIWVPEWGRFTGVRHTISPDIGLLYAPEIDTNKNIVVNPALGFSPFQKEQRSITIGLGNDVDMKWRLADTTATPSAKGLHRNFKLFSLNSTTAYNFAADSLQWNPINSVFSMQLTPSYLYSINFTHSLYDPWSDDPNKVRSPILTNYSFSFSRNFNFNGSFFNGLTPKPGTLSTSPWSAMLFYTFRFNARRVSPTAFNNSLDHQSNFSLNLRPTQNWDMSYNTAYNFIEGKFPRHSFSFSRILHCWRMNFTWDPVGPAKGWSFVIQIIDLEDIKLQAGSSRLQNNFR